MSKNNAKKIRKDLSQTNGNRIHGLLSSSFCLTFLSLLLIGCHTPVLLHRKQMVLPDQKPQEVVFNTPVRDVIESHSENPHNQPTLTWQDTMCERLDALMTDSLLLTTQLGICVYDLTDDVLLYARNAEQRMRPASCEKVVTAVSALALLGTDYSFVPTVLSPGWGWCWDDAVSGITDFGAKGKRKNAGVLYSEKNERSLVDVLMPMMKNSDNLLAESVFWQLNGKQNLSNIRLKDCQERVAAVMRAAGLNADDYVVADGSGLSLYNYISARALVMLLRFAYANSNVFNALYSTLPIAGVDGTLKNRLVGTLAENNVRAKTGTVTGISSLSGYCRTSNNHFLAFSIINQGVAKTAHGRDFQDRVCLIMTSPFGR